MRRRYFLTSMAGSTALSALPALSQPPSGGRLKITSVEFTRVEGHREAMAGVNRQYQVNPLHVYDELRPKLYRDAAEGKMASIRQSALYLKIGTGGGVEGFYGPIDDEAAVVVDRQLKPFLLGKDPLAVETLWDQMYRSNRHSRAGHYMMAISAVDNTLWDLRGRHFNTPVYRLLGGQRASVDAYGSCLGYSLEPEAVRTRSLALKKEGYKLQKWFLAHGPGDGPDGLVKNVELVKILRETLGEDADIMFDAFSGWDLNYALSWAKQVERYRPRWIEEAVHSDKIESFAELRRGTSIPVATGEHIYGRWGTYELLRAGAVNVIQADPEWGGGTSELVKICALCSVYDVHVIPHGHSIHAAMHVVASQSPMTCPMVENLIVKMGTYYHFEKDAPRVVNGKFALSDRPGFGIELDPAKVEKQTVARWS